MKRFILISIPLFIAVVMLSAIWAMRSMARAPADQEGITGVGADWYHADWHYRRPVTVANSGAALANYQVLVRLDSTNFNFSQANGDGSDLRVTDSDGVTPLPFWIESWTSSLAYVWVKVSNIPTSGATLYLYFGNAIAAPASRGDLTFDFFDDNWCQFPGSTGCGPTNPVLSAGQSWWESSTGVPVVFEDTSFLPGRPRYHMLYSGYGVIGFAKGYAWSSDLNTWTEYDAGAPHPPNPNPVIGQDPTPGPPDYPGNAPYTYGDAIKVGSTYYIFPFLNNSTAQRAQSTDLLNWTNFTNLSINSGSIGSGIAILKQGDGITPTVVNGEYWMVYLTSVNPGPMFLAHSSDLLNWTTTGSAILTPTLGTWDANGLWTPSFARLGNTYYIYYQGRNSSGNWEIGYAKADATGGVPPPSSLSSWTKSADSVIKRTAGGWDSSQAIHPMIRQFKNGTYYVFYTGNSAIGYAYASGPEGPWIKLGAAASQWSTVTGAPTVSSGVLTLGNYVGVRSNTTFTYKAVGYRANFGAGNGTSSINMWGGFISGSSGSRTMIGTNRLAVDVNLYLRNYVSIERNSLLGAYQNAYHVYEVLWRNGMSTGKVDHGSAVNQSLDVPTVTLPVTFYNYNNSTNPLLVDWVYVRQYRDPEPTTSVRNFNDVQQTQTIGVGANNFGMVHASIDVTTTGSLTSVQIIYYRYSHPNATASIQTGQYWDIIPDTDLTDYSLSLTLHHSRVPDANDRVCYYLGSGTSWNCDGPTRFDPALGTITRSDLNHLSEWAVQENSPTAAFLIKLRASTGGIPPGIAGLGLALIAVSCLAGALWRFRRKPKGSG